MTVPALLLLLLALWPGPTQEAVPIVPLTQRYDLEHRLTRFDLPGRLDEASGLAVSEGGTLYSHGDERGIVYSIDPVTEKVGQGFALGRDVIRDDFEGLATAGERFFLISSRGRLYEFREAPQGGSSPVRVTETGLKESCEVEGLAYHAATQSLLAACKTINPPLPEIRIHRIPLDPSMPPPPPIRIPFDSLSALGFGSGAHPSALDVDPATGTLVLLAAREGAILEVDLEGRVLDAFRFPGNRHPQPEGIAFDGHGILYVADEGGGGKGRLTAYGPKVPEGQP